MKGPLLLLLFIGFFFSAKAQLAYGLKAVPENTKSGTMYVLMKDTAAESVQVFKQVILDTWKFCKVSFINRENLISTLAPGNSYLSVEGMAGDRIDIMFLLYYWTPTDKTLQKDKAKLEPKDIGMEVHAFINLSFDKFTRNKPKSMFTYNFDFTDHAANWSPGLLKNYLQFIQANMSTDFYMKTGLKEFSKKEDLQKLKSDTLFIPESSLKYIDPYGYSNKPFMLVEGKELIDGYKYPVYLISDQELSNRILIGGKTIYYLNCVPIGNGTNKRVNVIKSEDGSLIYSDYAGGIKLNSGDLKGISKEID